MRLKNKTVLTAIVVGALCVSSAAAQPSVSVSAGANAPLGCSSLPEKELFNDLWPVGFNVAARGQIPVARWLLVDPLLNYRIYRFQGADSYVTIGDKFLSARGEPLQQLCLALGLRFHEAIDSSSITPFAEVIGGYEFERIGKVTLFWEDHYGTQYTTQRDPSYRRDWAFTVGFGFVVWLSPRVSLQPSFLWHGSGNDRNYELVTLDLVYALLR
jgi:hypothetical protein